MERGRKRCFGRARRPARIQKREEVIDLAEADEVIVDMEKGDVAPEGDGESGQIRRAGSCAPPAGDGQDARAPGMAGEDARAPGGDSGAQGPYLLQEDISLPGGEGGTTNTQHLTPNTQLEQLRAELEEVRGQGLQAHRRALLAENVGRIVPELVMGSTVEELDESIEVARRAFEAARASALAEMAASPVPAGNPVRQGPSVEGMSAFEKIAYGLKRE